MTEHIPGQTSSIGAVWPPEAPSHERMRGFYTAGVVDSVGSAADFAIAFGDEQTIAQKTEGVSRLSIRVVTHAGSLAALEGFGVPIEGALPIAGSEPGLVIAYTASNDDARRMDGSHLRDHRSLLAAAQHRPRATAESRARTLAAQGLETRLVNPAEADKLAEAFAPLYAPFGYENGDITELLANPNNTIAYATDGDRVVSTAMAEHASVHIGGLGTVKLVEITEASTDPAYQGRGLYKAVSGYLTEHLRAAEPGQINVLYGESNLAQPGVINAAHDNGRRFSAQDAAALGLGHSESFGILQQNFHVADGAETRRFNDFALSYVPLQ